ncbi:MAG: hypothetical protein OXJ64_08570, partial [Boseongicola sp.]|nr:hypothetical protein [Boseongicola sp.]
LDPYKAIIDARLEAFPKLSAKRLFDEVRAAGCGCKCHHAHIVPPSVDQRSQGAALRPGEPIHNRSRQPLAASFGTELGYGPFPSDDLTGTPNAGLGFGREYREYRLDWRSPPRGDSPFADAARSLMLVVWAPPGTQGPISVRWAGRLQLCTRPREYSMPVSRTGWPGAATGAARSPWQIAMQQARSSLLLHESRRNAFGKHRGASAGMVSGTGREPGNARDVTGWHSRVR